MCCSSYSTNVPSEPWWLKEPWLTAMRQAYNPCPSGGFAPYSGGLCAGYEPPKPPQIDWVAINRAIAESS